MADDISLFNKTKPKPALLLKLVFTDNQNIECKTTQYTIEEIDDLFTQIGDSLGLVKFWASDEQGEPVAVRILHSEKLISYLVLDFAAFEKTMRMAQLARGPKR